MMRNGQLSANELRQWAMQCGIDAARSDIRASDRQRLLKMQAALFELARTEDWLNPVIPEFILPEGRHGVLARPGSQLVPPR